MIASLCLAAVAPVWAGDAGRLSGKAVDENGDPLPGLKIRFVAVDADAITIPPVVTDKKGRFGVPNVPSGSRRIELEAAELAIKHIRIEVRDAAGSPLGRLDEEVPPGVLPPPIAVGPLQRANVELVVGPVSEGAPRGTPTAIAEAREESDALRRLNALFESGDAERLLAESDRVLEKEPGLGGALYLRAVALWRLGRLDEAEPAMRRALVAAPDQPGIRGTTGSVMLDRAAQLREHGDTEGATALDGEAEKLLREECAQEPASPTFLTNWIIVLERLGRTDETLEPLARLIEADPGNRAARLRRAELLIDAGRIDEGLEALPEDPDPGVAIVLYNGAVRLFDEGRIDPCRRLLDRAGSIPGAPPQVHQLLGRLLLQQGDDAGALRELKLFLELAPDDPTAETDRQLVKALEG